VTATVLTLLSVTVMATVLKVLGLAGAKDFAIVKFRKMVVASVALLLAATPAGSPPPDTLAVLLTLAAAAVAATFTVSVMGG
jgi:hypothetical protein